MTARRWAWGVFAIGVLGFIFARYLEPEFVLNLANQLWACF